MILKERSASHSVASTPAIIAPAISQARSVKVANSSSDRGTSPVSRTCTPWSGVRPKCARGGTDRVAGARARLQRVEVQPRLDLDEAADLLGPRRSPGDQRAPGQIIGPALAPRRRRPRRKRVIGASMSDSLAWPCDTPSKRGRKTVHHAAQRRIGGQGAQEGLGLDQLLGGGLHLLHGQEQQAVMVEESAAIGAAHVRKQVFVVRQTGGQRSRRRFRQFRRLAVDHHQDEIGLLRETGDRTGSRACASRHPRRSASRCRCSWRNARW